VITAGAAQKGAETRLDLVHDNLKIFEEIIGNICRYNTEAILLVVTNPVDILTEVTRRLSGFPAHRVIGSGTVLDTARLKFLLGQRLGVDMRQVHAFIIGEHGDSELAVFSSANISGIDLSHFCGAPSAPCDDATLDELFVKTRDAAYSIIRAKGSTYYGIAEATRRIVTAILRDESAILPVSVAPEGAYGLGDISISLPTILGREGVVRVLEMPLSEKEAEMLRHSAAQMQAVLKSVMPS
jgi:L-lactate dehydrogenase